MNNSIISWTKHTWNPVHGCSRISDGCRNCYAERISLQKGFTKKQWTHQNASDNIKLQYHKLSEPLNIKEPSLIFVNSMSDLFHPFIPDEFRKLIFDVMANCPQHQFQVLTKRPELAKEWTYKLNKNVWFGTSIENRKALNRIDKIRQSKAYIKFISFEPLLEDLGILDLTGIHWAIVGGESGKEFRKMDHAWARSIRDQCINQNVKFFFKQSAHFFTERGTQLIESDGTKTTWQQLPDFETSKQYVQASLL